MDLDKLRGYAPVMVRVAMSLVFLWFGINQWINTDNFLGYLPGFIAYSSYAKLFVLANGTFEIIAGTLMLLSIFTRWAALLLSLHLFAIAIDLGYGEMAVRDFGLALATLSIFMQGDDRWSLINRLRKKG